MELMTMARKKSKPAEPNRRPVALIIKGNEPWKSWVERLADHCRVNVSSVVDQALARHAKAEGFKESPPER